MTPDDACNPVTTPVTTPVTQTYPGAVTNPAPHHTTPHHTTKNTSSRTDAQTRGRANETDHIAALREIHPLDALAATLCLIRPDWQPQQVRAALANTGGSWADIARRALLVADDPDTRTPWRITNADLRPYAATPTPPTIDEQIRAGLLPPRKETP